jgi:hypothetical protein
MVTFLDLPTEVRVMIYREVFKNSTVKFVRKLRNENNHIVRRATSAALLISTKSINKESLIYFYELVRLDVSTILEEETGTLQSRHKQYTKAKTYPVSIDPALVRHIKIASQMFKSGGTKKFIKSLTKLESLTYDRPFGPYHIDDEGLVMKRQSIRAHTCSDWADVDKENFLELVAETVDVQAPKAIGKSCYTGCREEPIRGFVAAWAWNDMPFQLLMEADIFSEATNEVMV